MKSPIPLLLALPLVLAPGACRATSVASAPVAIAFASLAEGTGASEAQGPRVIRTAGGLERLWTELSAPGAMPEVDFTQDMVVYAADAAIERVVAEGGFLRVVFAPSSGVWQLVRLPLCEDPVRFESAR